MIPLRPKEKIMAIAVVNGGEISGRMMAASKNFVHPLDRLARTEVKAKKKPRTVPEIPTRVANSKLFQKALTWFLFPKISIMLENVKCPLFSKVNINIFAKGKRIKILKKIQIIITLAKTAGSFFKL